MPKATSSSRLVGGGGFGPGVAGGITRGTGGYTVYTRIKDRLYQSGDYPASVRVDATPTELNRMSDDNLIRRELSLEYMIDNSYAKIQDLTNVTATGLRPRLNRTGRRTLATENAKLENLIGSLTETKNTLWDRGFGRGAPRPSTFQ